MIVSNGMKNKIQMENSNFHENKRYSQISICIQSVQQHYFLPLPTAFHISSENGVKRQIINLHEASMKNKSLVELTFELCQGTQAWNGLERTLLSA